VTILRYHMFTYVAFCCRRSDRFPSTQNDRICSCHIINGDKTNDPVLFPHNEGKVFLFEDPVAIQRYYIVFDI